MVERAAEADVFEDGETFYGDPGYVESAREFLDGGTPPTFDTLSDVRYHVAYTAETLGTAVAGLDDADVGDDAPAQVGEPPGIGALSEEIRYGGDGVAETAAWIEVVESWLHLSMVAGGNAGFDREELAEKPAHVRRDALARAVRNRERSARMLSDARQFYRTFRDRQSNSSPVDFASARETYWERAEATSHDRDWYHSKNPEEESGPREAALSRLATLRPGENTFEDAEWARSDGLEGLATVRAAGAVAEFRGFPVAREYVDRLEGEASVPGSLLFEAKRRAVVPAQRIAATGDAFERLLLGRAAVYASKGDRFLTDPPGVVDGPTRAAALACYGVAAGTVEAIPAVADVLTDG